MFVFLSCLQAESRFAPWCAWTWTSDTSLAFTTAVWMVVGVHNRTTNCRSDTHMTFTSGFTNVNKVMLAISNNADRSTAVELFFWTEGSASVHIISM